MIRGMRIQRRLRKCLLGGLRRLERSWGKICFVELDREKAIGEAIGMASSGDLVLILGKGHEKTILRG